MIGVAFRSAVTPAGTLLRWVPPFGEAEGAIYINGTNRSDFIDWTTLRKEESEGNTSNTLNFTCFDGFTLTKGQEIVFYRGGTLRREFAGEVLEIEQYYDGIRHNICYRVTCQDYTWLFNDERFCMKWAGAVSASTIAAAIVALKAGFTSVNVEAALPDVTDFEIIFKTRGEALQLLAERVDGARWKVDYDKDVHFRTTPLTTYAPTDITDLSYSGDQLRQKDGLSQARTRQRGLGVRVRIPAFVPSGSTNVPVEGIDRLPTSGEVLVGSRLLTFTNISETQAPSGINGVAGAPTVALASSPAGGVLGAVRYAVTFETPDGEYPIGTQSAQVTGATLAAPSAGTAALQHTNGGSQEGGPGEYYTNSGTITRSSTSISFTLSGAVAGARVYIFGTSSGVWDGLWTIASVSGTTVTINGVSSSGPGSDTGNWQFITAGPLVGVYNYKFGFLSPRGITALSNAFSATGVVLSTTVAAPTVTNTTGGGLTSSQTYYYYYTLTADDGSESGPIALFSTSLGGSDTAVSIQFNQLASGTDWDDHRARSIRLYRGRAAEQVPRFVTEFSRAYLRVATAFGGTWTYVDTAADGALGALPGAAVIGSAIGISGLPSWSDARITGLAVLRTLAGGSDYYLHSIISSASITSFTDTTSDAELLQNSPVPIDSFGGHAVNLTSVATGPVGTTARNIYRLFNGVWRYCGTIPDNTTATFTDDKADDELGAPFKIAGYLTGISATSTNILAGEVARLHVVRDDAAAQTALQTALGTGDGVQEGPVIDDDTLGQDALEAACDAELATFNAGLKSVTFRSRDVNMAPGYQITITLGGTTQISGTFAIQRVTTSEYNRANDLQPLRQVTAGPVLTALRKTLAA